MANVIGDTVVRILVDANEFTKQIDKAGKKFADFGASLQKTGKTLTLLVTAPILAAGAAMVKFAADAEVSTRKFNTAFAGATDSANEFVEELSKGYGLATSQGQRLLANTGDLLKGFGATSGQAATTSFEVQKLAAALGAYNGIPVAEASANITKALLGETEGLKTLGVVIRQTDIDQRILEKGQQDLTGEAKLLARGQATLELAMRQSGDAISSFGENTQTASFQMTALLNDLKDTAVAFGNELLPSVTKIVKGFRELVQGFLDLDPAQKRTIIGIAGVAAVIGPLLIAVGKLVIVLPTLTLGIKALGVAMTGAAGPIGLAIAATVGLVAVIAGAVKSTKEWNAEYAKLQGALSGSASIADTTAELKKLDDIINQNNRDIRTQNAIIEENTGKRTRNSELAIQQANAVIRRLEQDNAIQGRRAGQLRQQISLAEDQAIQDRTRTAQLERQAALAAEQLAREQAAADLARLRQQAEADFLATLTRIDQLKTAGGITEKEALETKIKLREGEVNAIKEAAIAGTITATEAARQIAAQAGSIKLYQEALDRIIEKENERAEVIINNGNAELSITEAVREAREKLAQERVEEAKKESQEIAEKRKTYVDSLSDIEKKTQTVGNAIIGIIDNIDKELIDLAESVAKSVGAIAREFGLVEVALVATVASIGIGLVKSIENFFNRAELRAQESAKIQQRIANQVRDNAIKALDMVEDKRRDDHRAELERIEGLKDARLEAIEEALQAELASLGLQDKSRAEQLRSDIATAERRGEFAKKKALEDELAKAAIIEKYENERLVALQEFTEATEAAKETSRAAEAEYLRQSRVFARDKAILDRDIIITQMQLEKQKAISQLPWYYFGSKNAEVGAMYDSLIAQAQAIPIPNLAQGGIVQPKPGGTLARVAEAGVPEIVGPIDKVTQMLNSMGSTNLGAGENIHLVVNLDSKPFLDKIFPATKNRTVLISAASVV